MTPSGDVQQSNLESDYSTLKTKDTTTTDLLLCITITMLAAVASASFDVVEVIFEFTRAYEEFEVDELIPVVFVISLLASWFAYRRWRQQKDELATRIEIQKKLLQIERNIATTHRVQALGTVAAGVAHELNNVLQPIIGLASLLKREFDASSNAATHVEKIAQAGVRANGIVKQLLQAASNSTAGDAVSQIDARTEADEAIRLTQTGISDRIAIDRNFESPIGLIQAESGEVHQVVTNLIYNAAQAIADNSGRILVTLDTANAADDGSPGLSELASEKYLRLTVSDDGPGFSDEMLERALEPFVSTKEIGQGSGLGLAIVQRLVSARGGAVKLCNRPSGGASVEVLRPVHQ